MIYNLQIKFLIIKYSTKSRVNCYCTKSIIISNIKLNILEETSKIFRNLRDRFVESNVTEISYSFLKSY